MASKIVDEADESRMNDDVGCGLGFLLFFVGVAILLLAILAVHKFW